MATFSLHLFMASPLYVCIPNVLRVSKFPLLRELQSDWIRVQCNCDLQRYFAVGTANFKDSFFGNEVPSKDIHNVFPSLGFHVSQ